MIDEVKNLIVTDLSADNIKSDNLIGKVEMPYLKASIVWGLPTFCKVTESIDKENIRKTFEEIGYNEEKSRLMKEYIGEIK